MEDPDGRDELFDGGTTLDALPPGLADQTSRRTAMGVGQAEMYACWKTLTNSG